jgi:hypothetical protein
MEMSDYVSKVKQHLADTYENDPLEFEDGVSDEIYEELRGFAYQHLLSEEDENGEISANKLGDIEQFINTDGTLLGTILEEAVSRWEGDAYLRR